MAHLTNILTFILSLFAIPVSGFEVTWKTQLSWCACHVHCRAQNVSHACHMANQTVFQLITCYDSLCLTTASLWKRCTNAALGFSPWSTLCLCYAGLIFNCDVVISYVCTKVCVFCLNLKWCCLHFTAIFTFLLSRWVYLWTYWEGLIVAALEGRFGNLYVCTKVFFFWRT